MTALAALALVVLACAGALAWLVLRAERRIVERIDRLVAAVGVEVVPAPPVRSAPPIGDLAWLTRPWAPVR